jgi:hypothetical protein
VMGKEWLARHFQPTRSRSLPDGTLLIDRSAVVDDWTRVENQGVLIREGRTGRSVCGSTCTPASS